MDGIIRTDQQSHIRWAQAEAHDRGSEKENCRGEEGGEVIPTAAPIA